MYDVDLVFFRINVKLGGINTVPAPKQQSFAILTDPTTPTIVMGVRRTNLGTNSY